LIGKGHRVGIGAAASLNLNLGIAHLGTRYEQPRRKPLARTDLAGGRQFAESITEGEKTQTSPL